MANDLAVTLYHRKARYDDLHGDVLGFDMSNDIGLHKFSTTIQDITTTVGKLIVCVTLLLAESP
jgi:hypothetical protein